MVALGLKVTVAMLGARMSYAVPRALHKSGCLEALVTDYYSQSGFSRAVLGWVNETNPVNIGRNVIISLLSRNHPELSDAKIHHSSLKGLSKILSRRNLSKSAKVERGALKQQSAIDLAAVFESLPDKGDAVYAFHGAAAPSFNIAKQHNMYCILEQSIAARPFTSSLLAPEVDRWGEWYAPQGLPELVALNHEPSQMEWEAADKIVAASDFVRDSLIASGVDERKIEVFPYGVPLAPKTVEKSSYAGDRPLRILFAGNADLRKGVHHLLEAANSLGKRWVECRVVGNVGLKDTVLRDHSHVVDFRGRVPRLAMEYHYRWADVLILPSLAEGSATVVYESLSFGVPAIVTRNAGTVVRQDQNGQVIPVSSSEAVKRAILRYIEDPELLRAHSECAASSTFEVSFERYERDLIAFFKNLQDQV